VVAVPVEVAPRARRRRVKGQSTFDRIRQPQTNFIYDIQIFYPKLLEGSYADFQIATLQQENILLPDYLLVASMNSIYYQQSELSVILEAHNLLQQSSEPRKIRGEADAISTQRPFSKFEFSHLFLRCWSVISVANARRAKPLTSVLHLNRNYQPKLSMYTS